MDTVGFQVTTNLGRDILLHGVFGSEEEALHVAGQVSGLAYVNRVGRCGHGWLTVGTLVWYRNGRGDEWHR